MYNYMITQISPIAVLKTGFCCGVAFGGLFGILLGIMERDMLGIFGGLFLGFAGGSGLGLAALACAAIFNVLAPQIGGIAVTLQPLEAAKPAEAEPQETPEG